MLQTITLIGRAQAIQKNDYRKVVTINEGKWKEKEISKRSKRKRSSSEPSCRPSKVLKQLMLEEAAQVAGGQELWSNDRSGNFRGIPIPNEWMPYGERIREEEWERKGKEEEKRDEA